MEQLRYPIGKFAAPETVTAAQRTQFIERLESLPDRLRLLCSKLSAEDLAVPYRPGGWTASQVIHHLADSHVNAYIRLKLALTEENPMVKPYEENEWANIPEAKSADIASSLHIIEGIHARMVATLRGLTAADFARSYFHPQHGKSFDVDYLTALYAWHGDHHLSHVQLVLTAQTNVSA